MSARESRKRGVLTVGIVVGAGIAAIAVLARRARRNDDAATPIPAQTRNRRRLELARVGGRAGAGFALHRARRTFASAERRVELDRRFELRTADEVAQTLGNMKGAFIKVGQRA